LTRWTAASARRIAASPFGPIIGNSNWYGTAASNNSARTRSSSH